MGEGVVHTVYADRRWKNSIEGYGGLLPGAYGTKAEAVAVGRGEAKRRKTDHVIHREDGSIEERNSYGADPAQPG